jgi:hypothetical protein
MAMSQIAGKRVSEVSDSRGIAGRLTELNGDLSEVVGMPTPLEEAHIADRTWLLSCRTLLEAVLLYITHGLHEERNNEDDDRDDIRRPPKVRLSVLQHPRTVNNRNRQADRPAPKHLKHPESQKLEEVVSLVVESVVFAGLQDTEEEERGQSGAPQHDHDADDDVAGDEGAAEGEGEDGEPDEVGAAHEVGQLVEFEGEGDGEAD